MKNRILLTAFSLIVVAALLLPLGTAAQATAPTLEVGDSWAMGAEVDIGDWAGPAITMYKAMAEEEGNISIDQADVDGSAAVWVLSEVASATADTYIIETETAMSLELAGDVEISGDMPEPGYYENEDPIMDNKKVSATLDLDCAVTVKGTSTIDANDMTIQKQTLDISGRINVQFSGDNIPRINDSYDYGDSEGTFTESMNVSYSDFNVGAALIFDASLTFDFDEGMDIFDFPIEVDKMWKADSDVTISGTYSGSLDVQGLPDDIKEEAFGEETLGMLGIDDFPIVFEDISGVPGQIGNGKIYGYDTEAVMYLWCSGTKSIEMADGSTSEVYIIKTVDPYTYNENVNPSNVSYDPYNYTYYDPYTYYDESPLELPFDLYYSPDDGFFVSFGIDSEALDNSDYSDMVPSGTAGLLSMEPVSKSEAESGISEVSSYQSSISTSADPNDGMGAVLAIIAIVVVIGVVAVVFVMMKKKPSVPGGQGQTPLPPPPADMASAPPAQPMEGSAPPSQPMNDGMTPPPPPPMD